MRLSRRLLASFLAAMLLLALFAAAAPARGKLHHRHAHGPRVARLGSAVALRPARALRGASSKPVTPPAGASSSDLLFYGDNVADFAMNQSAPDAVSEVPDPAGGDQPAMEMTVDNSDVAPVTPTSDPRAQLLSPAIIDNGEELWWSGRFFLPRDFPRPLPPRRLPQLGPRLADGDGGPLWRALRRHPALAHRGQRRPHPVDPQRHLRLRRPLADAAGPQPMGRRRRPRALRRRRLGGDVGRRPADRLLRLRHLQPGPRSPHHPALDGHP